MDYIQALAYLKGLEKLGIRFRLENTRDLLNKLGFEYSGGVVHVSGTNGKGSCAAAIAKVLETSGRKVALYTSPELMDFTERIRVNGKQITKEKFAALTTELKPLIDSMPDKPTFFEATTALALKHFADEGVDVMVLEVGMGGRLDSTNILPSAVSVITNVALEHMQYLGDTVEAIAAEKAGIIYPNSTLVTAAEGGALRVLEEDCKNKKARILRAQKEFMVSDVSSTMGGISFTLKTQKQAYNLRCSLRGEYQAQNLACAAVAAEALGVSERDITEGIRKTIWPGRLDIVQTKPTVILDCAHNPHGIESSFKFIREHKSGGRLFVIAGFSNDKDWHSMVQTLSEADLFVATRYQAERSADPEELLEGGWGEKTESVDEAIDLVLSQAKADDLILVTGSIYVVGEAMRRYRDQVNL